MPRVTFPLPEPWVSVWEQDPVHLPFKRAPGFLADSLLFQADRVPVDFHCQMPCRLLFPGLVLWVVDPSVGLRLQAPQRYFCSQDILWLLSHRAWVQGPALSASLTFLPVSMWLPP